MYKLLVLLPTTTGQTLSMLHFNSKRGLKNATEWLRGTTVSGLECKMLVVKDHDEEQDTPACDWREDKVRHSLCAIGLSQKTIDCIVEFMRDAGELTDNTGYDDWKNTEKRINDLRKTGDVIREGVIEGLNAAFGANRVNMYIDRRELVRLIEIVIGNMPADAPASAIYSVLQDYYKNYSFTVKP